jgi:hypothetical protein
MDQQHNLPEHAKSGAIDLLHTYPANLGHRLSSHDVTDQQTRSCVFYDYCGKQQPLTKVVEESLSIQDHSSVFIDCYRRRVAVDRCFHTGQIHCYLRHQNIPETLNAKS